MARSTRFIAARDKRSDEVKTALTALRNDLDSVKQPCLLTFSADDTNTGATRYPYPWYVAGSATATERFILLPFACTLRRLFVFWTAGTGSGSVTAFVRRNSNLNTSLSVTGKVVGAGGNNQRDSVRCEAGDRISIGLTPSGTVTASPTGIIISLEVSF